MPERDPAVSYPGKVDIFETDAEKIIRDRISATYTEAFGSRSVSPYELAQASNVAINSVIEQDEYETVAGIKKNGEIYAYIKRVPYV